MSTSTPWMIAFLILFALIMLSRAGYANPPGMRAPWPGGITFQVNQGNFGYISHNDPHTFYAWDFDLPMGTPVVAAANGTIAVTGYRNDGYGNRIHIRHVNRTYSLYAHLESFLVAPGENVLQGQIIGYSGNTGYTGGPHLHFSIIDKANYSLPSIFSDIGAPVEGQCCTSQNWFVGRYFCDPRSV
ncbi:MAG: M23 family metallopeptidase [Bacilli bacterium]